MTEDKRERPKLQQLPNDVITLNDYESLAKDFINHSTYQYISGGSGTEQTLKENAQAFSSVTHVHQLLGDCTKGSTRTSMLGQNFRHPIFLAPVAYQKLVHPNGELATAQAAEAIEACMVTSTLSSFTLEEVAKNNSGPKWFQLYWQPKKQETLALLRRAECADYKAIMITLDAPIQSLSHRAKRANFVMPNDVRAVNLSQSAPKPQVTLSSDQSVIFQGMMSEAPTWQDLTWLLKQTTLPIIVKGVLNPTDAARLKNLGVSGIVVSNHGGRALDGSPATISVLPSIRKALGPAFPILLDSGVRSGYDVFKALNLGANAVMIGRPQMYALSVAGALGVAHMLKLLRDELEYCMALAGRPTIP